MTFVEYDTPSHYYHFNHSTGEEGDHEILTKVWRTSQCECDGDIHYLIIVLLPFFLYFFCHLFFLWCGWDLIYIHKAAF